MTLIIDIFYIKCIWLISDDHSRVILKCFPDDVHSDYVNADYIDVSIYKLSFINVITSR